VSSFLKKEIQKMIFSEKQKTKEKSFKKSNTKNVIFQNIQKK
jgi:hypothetical protein